MDQLSSSAAALALPRARLFRAQPPRTGLAGWLEKRRIATDLARDVGSAPWWRGLGLVMGCSAGALMLLPGLAPLPGLAASPLASAQLAEWRAGATRPLAMGGAIGRIGLPGPFARPTDHAAERPRLDLVATLGEGDTLADALRRSGVGPADMAQALALVKPALPAEGLAPGTRIAITLGPRADDNAPRRLDGLQLHAGFAEDLALSRQGGTLVLARHALAVDATPLHIRGVVGEGGLYRSARAQGVPAGAMQQYLEALDAHFSIDEVRPGDVFDLVVTSQRAADGQSRLGNVLYAGLEQAGRPRTQLVRWGGEGQFFDALAPADTTASAGLVLPVAGARITSSFGMRYHPILGYERMHSGTDLAAPWGSPVYAVADGYVEYAGWHGGHGNYLRLAHGGGVETGYGHLSRYAVASGMRVRAGQVIGYVGSTGLSTGAHLHYEVFQSGRAIDPMSVHFIVRAGVDPREQAVFRARLAALLRLPVKTQG
ncbi:MAG TPA: M23 family metallopeptidase [Novosphingobium sp.]|nr:M23 family metallopeptidase [Novosphingobium sp.]